VLITTSSETAYRNITERGEPAGRPAARESRVQRARRRLVCGLFRLSLRRLWRRLRSVCALRRLSLTRPRFLC
jgi:hypothetical protein